MSEQKSIKVEVKLEEEDLIKFNRSLFYGRTATKIFIVISILLIIYSGFMTVAKFLYMPEIPAAVIFIFILSFVYLFILPILLKSSAKKLYRTNLLLQKPQIYIITESELEITSEAASVKIDSSEVFQILETKYDFEFFISKYQAYIIPKRCIEKEMDSLRNILTNSKFTSKFKNNK